MTDSILDQVMRALPPFPGTWLSSQHEFRQYLDRLPEELAQRAALESVLALGDDTFWIDGRCAVCSQDTRFLVDRQYGHATAPGARLTPNWRERVECQRCRLNNRMRAAVHFLLSAAQPVASEELYITEQVTPLYGALAGLLPKTVGSEFLGPTVQPGTTVDGVRHEDLTRLSFEPARFRFLLTFDVLEHVPDTGAALEECRRVLQPGGWLVLTVPFDLGSATTLRRATVKADGEIEHLVPPEYHGDPLSSRGVLSFYTFGWDLLPALASHGFTRPSAVAYWSRPLGYLGSLQILFCARRS